MAVLPFILHELWSINKQPKKHGNNKSWKQKSGQARKHQAAQSRHQLHHYFFSGWHKSVGIYYYGHYRKPIAQRKIPEDQPWHGD